MVEKLRTRLTAISAAGTGLVLLVMAAFCLRFSVNQLQGQYEAAFQSNVSAVCLYLQVRDVVDHAWLAQTEAADGLLIRVDVRGEELLYTGRNSVRSELTAKAGTLALAEYGFNYRAMPTGTLQPDQISFQMKEEETRYRAAAAAVPSGKSWYNVIILKDMAEENGQIHALELGFCGLVLLALAGLYAAARFFAGWAMKPVRENQRRQAEFISAASHELRSPLAVIRVSAEAIRTAPEKAGAFASKIEGECDRLSHLTGDLLSLAGADGERLRLAMGELEPETLLLDMAERYEHVAGKQGITLTTELPEEALPRLCCDSMRMEQTMAILLDNAIRYTPEGGTIRLSAVRKRKSVLLAVEDSGPGIPDEEKERVFERFYRGDASRTEKEHYGLGLSIARELMELQDGEITVSDSREGGARFVLSIPIL